MLEGIYRHLSCAYEMLHYSRKKLGPLNDSTGSTSLVGTYAMKALWSCIVAARTDKCFPASCSFSRLVKHLTDFLLRGGAKRTSADCITCCKLDLVDIMGYNLVA